MDTSNKQLLILSHKYGTEKDLYFQVPQEWNWKEGDTIIWEIQEDNSIILKTAGSLKKNLGTLTTLKKKKSTTTSIKATGKTKSGRGSTKITILQSRKKDLFPHMGMYRFPYRFEPAPEIQDKLNLAWFDEHYGEERMKKHIRKHKLK